MGSNVSMPTDASMICKVLLEYSGMCCSENYMCLRERMYVRLIS